MTTTTHTAPLSSPVPDDAGYYGEFGGAFIPEMLHPNVEELRERYLDIIAEPSFQAEYAYLLRDYDPKRGNTVRLKIADRQGKVIDGMELARPLNVDNFEGVAAVPRRDGRIRFYLLVDDNFGVYSGKPTDQRTLLMAFDWTPPK